METKQNKTEWDENKFFVYCTADRIIWKEELDMIEGKQFKLPIKDELDGVTKEQWEAAEASLNGKKLEAKQPLIYGTAGNMEKATRYNQGKLKWSLPDYKSLEPLIRVMMWGEEKHDRDNWKKGFNKQELLDSLTRHVIALHNGEDIDPEHGISHIGGVLFNAMAYEYCRINNKFVE